MKGHPIQSQDYKPNCPYCGSHPLEYIYKEPKGQAFNGSYFNKLKCPNDCIKTKFWLGKTGAHRRWEASVRHASNIQRKFESPVTRIKKIKNQATSKG